MSTEFLVELAVAFIVGLAVGASTMLYLFRVYQKDLASFESDFLGRLNPDEMEMPQQGPNERVDFS